MTSAQIFISYAHLDDESPPDSPECQGFVTFFYQALQHHLKQLGQPYPLLWRDKRNVEGADQFNRLITEALDKSEFFLVLLSHNWLAQSYCQSELDYFVKSAQKKGVDPKERIVVVLKNQFFPDERPQWLRGQEGYPLFVADEEGRAGYEQLLYERGKPHDDYFKHVGAVSRFLWSKSRQLPLSPQPPAKMALAASGRTIFLAKPAQDMRQAYQRVSAELTGAGYTVVPEPATEMPTDTSAADFLSAALEEAEFSIHLLGDMKGFVPECSSDHETMSPIAVLQLEKAVVRAREEAEAAGGKEHPFRRLIWAPKLIETATGSSADVERDALAVLGKFGQALAPSDKVEGGNLSVFLDLVREYLKATMPRPKPLVGIKEGAQIYVYHRVEDTGFAMDLALALQKLKLDPVLPAFEGDAAELGRFHRENLRSSDKVFLCWANAPEVWVRATAREFRILGEDDGSFKISCCGIVGPPPGTRKSTLLQLPSKEFEAIHDFTAIAKPLPEDLAPLL